MKFFLFRLIQAIADLAALMLALVLAFALRFEGEIPFEMLKRMAFLAPYVVGTQFAMLRISGTHRFAWRYVGLKEATHIAGVLSLAALIFLSFRIGAGLAVEDFGHAIYFILPVGVIALDLVLAIFGVLGLRAVRRLGAEHSERAEKSQSRPKPTQAKRTLFVGAGQAGLLLAKEVANRPEAGIVPLGFIDDDPLKVGTIIHGLRVLGKTSDLERLSQELAVEQLLITVASAKSDEMRALHERCARVGLPVRIIPGLYELMDGRVNLSRIREVTIEDLLGRPPVELEDEGVRSAVRGGVVLVTGAGGSIGSELCRQLLTLKPKTLLLVERAENSLFYIHRELTAREHEETVVVPCIADITDRARIESLLEEYGPQLIFHAAAHKHVPMMEWNIGEAIKNNVFGTKCVAELASKHNVKKFVMVSTDKAVNPTSVMGCTKRVAELVVQSIQSQSATQFITVRFGNVLGSAGSVIPIFREQIKSGGPVTVTHPDMTRYFMTIPEACQLVLHAGTMGHGGEIFILDMGEPVKIVDLARDLIRLSGMTPDEDIAIEFSGIRPGEKLYEELSSDFESAEKTRHPKIFIGKASRFTSTSLSELETSLEALRESASSADDTLKRGALKNLVPEFSGK